MNFISNLSIDCVIFGFDSSGLKVLLYKRNCEPEFGKWALPGGLIKENENLDDAANRILKGITGLKDVYLEQIAAFGDINRFPLRRVLTISYFALLDINKYDIILGENAQEVKWTSVSDIPKLVFDHNLITNNALIKLQNQVRKEPIGFNLLPKKFTLTDLQRLYESILNTEFDKRNFRKKIAKMGLLKDTGTKQQNVAHRAAKLYQFDKQVYKQLKKKSLSFDL